MADESEDFSLSENVRSFIQQAFDDNIDLSVPANRKEMIKQFKEKFPKEKQSTIDSLFSREIPGIAKSYGVNPDQVKKSPAKKYSKSNEIKVNPTEKKSGVTTVTATPGGTVSIKNPATLKDGSIQNQQQAYKYEIKSSQLGAFSDSIWGIGQVFSEDLEDFTESEKQDLGDLWQPVAQQKLGNNDRGQTVLAIGGTLGIVARKAKTAKSNRKVRKEKEKQEKSQSQIESKDQETTTTT